MKSTDQEGLARALFEEAGDALFLLDPETDQLLDANAKAQRLTGLPLRDLLRLPLDHLVRFGGPGGLQRLRGAAGKSGTFHSQEGYFLLTASPGVFIPVNLTVSRLHVPPRTLALITARDAREHYAVQERLKGAEEELRHVLDSVSDCLWTADVDAEGRWTYRSLSAAVEKIAGQPADFFRAGVHRWWGAIHPEDQPRWEKALVRLRSGQAAEEEYRLTRPDGTFRWVRESARPTGGLGGRGLRLAGVITDITERKEAEARRAAGDDLPRAFLDGAPAPAFLADQAGRLVYVNPPFAALTGRAPAEVVGRAAAEVLPAETARALFGPDAPARQAVEVRAPDGSAGRWLVVRFPVRTGDGRRLLGGLVTDLGGGDVRGGPRPAA
jgi:PAS domain S-box-containing protein